jgi:hypothetical protein
MSRDSVLVGMKHERDRGRWSRWMPDAEIEAALDGALEKLRSGEWASEAANDPDAGPTLAQAIARELKPYTEEELLAALEPHPHIFSDGQAGIFPVGEVTVVAAPPRAGKTYGMLWLMAMAALGRDVVGLPSTPTRALIYSAEDSRKQYARKLAALRSALSSDDAARLMARVVVPDLEAPGLAEARTLIKIAEGTRRPAPTLTPESIVTALRPLTIGPDRYGVILFETASTLSEADEDNPGMRMVSGVLKRVARELGVAVVLVHHTSQVAGKEIAQLNFSIYDIRGGTALPSNTRQCFLLLNLGSGDDPYPDKDGRTVLRRYLTQGFGAFGVGRITALIPLDASSQLADPPPLFLQWVGTPTGPAMQELAVPETLVGASWRKVRQKVLAWGSAENQKAKRDQEAVRQADDVVQVVDAVKTLHARGKAPTVSAVDKEVGRTGGWSQKRLYVAVDQGLIARREEKVPRVKDPVLVYRPASDHSQQEGGGDFSD